MPLFFIWLTQAVLFWYGTKLLVHGGYTVVQVFVCLLSVTFSAQGAGQFLSFAPDATKAISATLNVTRLLEHVPDIDVASQEGKPVDQLEAGNIEFRDVYFSYPTRYLIKGLFLI